MNTDTQHTNGTNGIDPEVNRRQVIKTVGVGAGAAALGSGSLPTSTTQTAAAIEWDGCAKAATGIGWWTGLGSYTDSVKECLAGTSENDVEETDNTESYVWNIANTIADTRSGPTGDRTEMDEEFINPSTGQSSYARAAGSTVVETAAIETINGNGDSAENAADTAYREQTTRSILRVQEMWNSAVLRMVESGALLEDYEEGTGVVSYNSQDPAPHTDPGSAWSPVETTSPEGENGYLVWKGEVDGSNLPYPPTELEGRDEPLSVYGLGATGGYMIFPFQPSDFNSNWYSTLASQITIYDKPELTANTADHSQITWLDCYRMYDIFNQIYDEYDQIGSNLNSVVNDTVNGLEEGTIELSQVISGDTLLDEYDPNDQRGQLHREAMAVGMEMPGEPGFQAKVSHPDLSADSLWVDLFLRLADGVDLTVSGPMTIPAADYDHALIGYAGQASGEYQYRTLDSGSGDLEILQLETTDQEVREVDKTVGEGGTVVLAPTEDENTPMPLAEPDPKYDSWGISVYAADDSSWGGTVGDAYTMDQDGTEVWAVDTSLSQGLAVERIHYNPDSTFKNTSVWTPDGSGYSVTDAETTIEFRRALNEAIDQAFSDAFGGGGFFDGGLPSLPGLGFIESVIVVILAIFGLNAASG